MERTPEASVIVTGVPVTIVADCGRVVGRVVGSSVPEPVLPSSVVQMTDPEGKAAPVPVAQDVKMKVSEMVVAGPVTG